MRIQDLKGHFHKYTYKDNHDYTEIEDRFLRNTTIALDFLIKSNALTITFKEDGNTHRIDVIDVLIADTENNIFIRPGNRNLYNPKLNGIMFYDTHGVVFRKNHNKKWFRRNKGYNSPVSLLSHELIHCYN